MSAHDEGDSIVIGLVNNMPDGALKTTERQFRELLASAAGDLPVRLRLFSLPEAVRGEASRAYITDHYEKFSTLWSSRLDGLIVTGTEPRTAVLADEPYWGSLTKLVDWAQEHTASTVWSCLAAHAAVYHLDGIGRQKFPEKLSGVFDCARAGAHRILAGAPDAWRIPHSRSNDLPAPALSAAGYQILSHRELAGADMFIKQRRACLCSCRVIRNMIRIRCCASITATSADSCARARGLPANAQRLFRCRYRRPHWPRFASVRSRAPRRPPRRFPCRRRPRTRGARLASPGAAHLLQLAVALAQSRLQAHARAL
jgi:hypothetical protein